MKPSLALALLVAGIPAIGMAQKEQRPVTIDFVVDEARPLWGAVTRLHKQFGWVVTFEDAPVLFAGDRTTMQGIARPGVPLTQIPRGGSFAFAMTSTASASDIASDVLTTLVQRYNQSQIAIGRFKVAQDGDVYHVFPEAYRAASGELKPYTSSLEATVSVPAGTTTLLEALDNFANSVSAATGRGIFFVHIPHGLAGQKITLRGRRTSGRAALVEILGQTRVKTTTALLCSPGEPIRCYLNLTQVNGSQDVIR